MYSAIWRALPGPTWLKLIQVLILLVGAVLLLFQGVFPWVAAHTSLIDTTVG